MRFQAAQMRSAAGATAAALLLVGAAAACSSSSGGGASPTPNLPQSTSTSGTSAAGSTTPTGAGSLSISYDPSAAMAQKQQITQCQAALVPLFDNFKTQHFPADEARTVSVTPAKAQTAMKQAIDYYNTLLSQDPNAATDGKGSAATKFLEAFCATPDGAGVIGQTPLDALRPVKAPPAPKPQPTKTTTHH